MVGTHELRTAGKALLLASTKLSKPRNPQLFVSTHTSTHSFFLRFVCLFLTLSGPWEGPLPACTEDLCYALNGSASISFQKCWLLKKGFLWPTAELNVSVRKMLPVSCSDLAPFLTEQRGWEVDTPRGIACKVWPRSHLYLLGPHPATIKSPPPSCLQITPVVRSCIIFRCDGSTPRFW